MYNYLFINSFLYDCIELVCILCNKVVFIVFLEKLVFNVYVNLYIRLGYLVFV